METLLIIIAATSFLISVSALIYIKDVVLPIRKEIKNGLSKDFIKA